ncbi:MAG: AtpZ/AtpI family protein [Caulobacteraceae bacterium]
MPDRDEPSQGALRRLDKRLDAFDAARKARPLATGMGAAGDGYRLLGQMLGGVLGGIGLGWLVDRFAHTSPWGVVGGLVIGAGLSIYATVRTASAMSARAKLQSATPPSVAADDEEDEDRS